MSTEKTRLTFWRSIALNVADDHGVRATGRFLSDIARLIAEAAYQAGFHEGRKSVDPNTTPEEVRLTIALHPEAFRQLQMLHATGQHGVTVTNAAEDLLLTGLRLRAPSTPALAKPIPHAPWCVCVRCEPVCPPKKRETKRRK